VPLLAVIGDVAATVDWAAEAAPGCTKTAELWVMATPLAVAEIVLVSARIELIEPLATPTAEVNAAGWVMVLSEPLDEITTVAPDTGLPN